MVPEIFLPIEDECGDVLVMRKSGMFCFFTRAELIRQIFDLCIDSLQSTDLDDAHFLSNLKEQCTQI